MDRPVIDPDGTGGNTSDDPRQELAAVFVRLTRNASADNREILAREGLRWNGRSAGWSGRVTPEALQRLRDAFPGRVEGPSDAESSAAHAQDKAGLEAEAEAPPVASPDAPLVNLEPAASPFAPAKEPDDAEAAVPPTQPAVPTATRLLTSPFRAPLPRRPLPT